MALASLLPSVTSFSPHTSTFDIASLTSDFSTNGITNNHLCGSWCIIDILYLPGGSPRGLWSTSTWTRRNGKRMAAQCRLVSDRWDEFWGNWEQSDFVIYIDLESQNFGNSVSENMMLSCHGYTSILQLLSIGGKTYFLIHFKFWKPSVVFPAGSKIWLWTVFVFNKNNVWRLQL